MKKFSHDDDCEMDFFFVQKKVKLVVKKFS